MMRCTVYTHRFARILLAYKTSVQRTNRTRCPCTVQLFLILALRFLFNSKSLFLLLTFYWKIRVSFSASSDWIFMLVKLVYWYVGELLIMLVILLC